MQDIDYHWYRDNYHEIYSRYGNSYVVIKDKAVLGAYSTYAEGLAAASATEIPGSFIVQRCTSDEAGFTNYISSMNFKAC